MSDATAPDAALRDQIAEALVKHACRESREKGIKLSSFLETVIRAGAESRADAVMPVVTAALTAARDETARQHQRAEKLQRQVMGYRGMKDVYLSERNEAYRGLIEAENIIERLCDDREAGQDVVKAALTEQRERAEKAEAAVQRVRAIHNGGSPENPVLCIACCEVLPCPTLTALDREGT
jgi:hypothetical protein